MDYMELIKQAFVGRDTTTGLRLKRRNSPYIFQVVAQVWIKYFSSWQQNPKREISCKTNLKFPVRIVFIYN